jgi:hypothetical protein
LISVLLFCALPAAVLLLATGTVDPNPLAYKFSGLTPLSIKAFITAFALSSESF